MSISKYVRCCAVALVAGCFASAVTAGPVIIDGTDANEHGSATATTNLAGWLYMQRALENLAGSVSGSVAKVVVDLGTTASKASKTGPTARGAIDSAFSKSTLPVAGWTLVHVDGAVAIGNWLSALSTANTGILYIPTAGNSVGDLQSDELAVVNVNAASIANFVSGTGDPTQGGALFSQGESPSLGGVTYGWLTALIPGIVVTDVGGAGVLSDITLTADGMAAFPGLTNTDLAGADPWHNYFSGDLGGLKILGTAPQGSNTRNVILGGGAGTVIGCGQPGQPPCPTPEPDSLPLLGVALLALGAAMLRLASRRLVAST